MPFVAHQPWIDRCVQCYHLSTIDGIDGNIQLVYRLRPLPTRQRER
jgi:hypothetical protein